MSYDLNALAIEQSMVPARQRSAAMRVPKTSKKTQRGFPVMEWRDQYWQPCKLQASSLATMNCIWLGVKDDPMHLDQKQAKALALALLHFSETGELP